MSIAEYLQESFHWHVWFYPRSLGYLASVVWSSRHCQGWGPSHSMGLNLDPFSMRVCHSHCFYTIFTPVKKIALYTRQIVNHRFCDWVGVPSPPLVSPAWLKHVASSGSIYPIPRSLCSSYTPYLESPLMISWNFHCPTFLANPKDAPDLSSLSQYSLSPSSHHLIPPVPMPTPYSELLSFTFEIQVSPTFSLPF